MAFLDARIRKVEPVPLNTKVEMKKGFLQVTLEGPFDLPSSLQVNDTIMGSIERYKATRIFVDFRGVTGDLKPMERFQYAEMLAKKYQEAVDSGRIELCRFAFLGKYPQLDPEGFDETVAVNRGLPIRATDDRRKAFEWLEVEQDP